MFNLLKNHNTKILFALILCLFVSLGAPISAKAEFAGVEETACGDLTYSISTAGHLKITGTGGYSRKYFNGNTYLGPYPFWYEYKDYIKTAEVNGVSEITNMRHMFSGLTELESIVFKNTDTSNVTDMCHMFSDCTALKSLDLSGFDTKKVTDMESMFEGCTSLESLIVKGENFSTANVTNMYDMFYGCENLQILDLSGFQTGNVTGMGAMFCNCKALKTLDLSNFDTSNVTWMATMFTGCTGLETLTLGDSFSAENVTTMANMFQNCKALKRIDLSCFKESSVTDMSTMFDGCSSLTSVSFSEEFDTSNVDDMLNMFQNCSSLETVNIRGFDTGNVEDMGAMFSGCAALKSLDLSHFNTENVTRMGYMFEGCEKLESVDVSSFNTENVAYMWYMFSGCQSLEELDLSHFNTANVTLMTSMFENCTSLKSLDVSNFDTGKVTDVKKMFSACHSLKELDLSSFVTTGISASTTFSISAQSLETFTSGKDKRLYKLSTSAAGWVDAEGNRYADAESIELEPNTTLYRLTDTYKINYVYDGELSDSQDTYKLDEKLVLTGYVNKEHYTFAGWYTDEQLIQNITEIKEGTYGDITLYAKLIPDTYSITYKNIDGVTNTNQLITDYTYGKKVSLATPVKAFYSFEGWYTDEQLTQSITEIKAGTYGDVILYAKLTPNVYAISYKNIEGVTNVANLTTSYSYGEKTTLVAATSNFCIFDGWYTDEQLTQTITEITAGTYGDITIYAKLTPKTFSVTYKNIDGVTNTDQLISAYTYGEKKALESPLKSCFLFDGWYSDEGMTKPFKEITETVGGDIVLYAKWKPNHDLDKTKGVVIKEPTTISEGEVRYPCKNCAYTETEKTPRVVTEESQIADETILSTPNDDDIKGSDFTKFQARAVKTTQTSIRLKWNKIEEADGYKIYGNKCGKKNKYEFVKDIKGNKKLSWTHKKRKKGTYYKYIIRAYKIVDGQEVTIAVSKTIHTTTTGGKKGNAKAVKIKTDKKMKKASGGYTLTVKLNKKYKIKASEVAGEKKISRHRKVKFDSSNPDIATVSQKGVVKAKSPGTCYIYAYAQNGVYKKIKVVVK